MKNKLLSNYIEQNNADGIILFNKYNRYWLYGIETSLGVVVANTTESIYITDSRYYLNLKTKLDAKTKVWCIENKPGCTFIDLIAKAINELHIKNLIIEKNYLTLNELDLLPKNVNLIPLNTMWLRVDKTDDEIKKLQAAADIIVDVVKWVWTWIKPGYTEKEVAKQISIKILELGAQGNSFDPIVAAGKNGAEPHHQPTDYIIQDGDMVTIDLGCVYDHYCSDMTRTFVVGNKCNTPEMLEIYKIVQESQALGVANSVIGASTTKIDNICRDYINASKYRELFCHGTGHGVGIEVHEAPVVSINQNTTLKNNQVITIEPGIYLANVGGVRIEDTIVISNETPIILTKGITKDLVYVKN